MTVAIEVPTPPRRGREGNGNGIDHGRAGLSPWGEAKCSLPSGGWVEGAVRSMSQ